MIIIQPQEGENLEKMLRRYKRKFDRLGIAREVRERMHYIPKSVQKREQIKRAAYRQRMQQLAQQG
ncbi:MAG: 30S ribosomal protein S21 [Bacteroidia bacterium]|nr:30S ribosomal protein S21 [Bacteroidia bacterium]MDW8235485.1 30S ribosomal protein S21 [Bacteroidia bacterium]